MNTQTNTHAIKKLTLQKTTLHLLTPQATGRMATFGTEAVPTEGCTPNCGSGLCFVAGAQTPAAQPAVPGPTAIGC